MPRQLKVNACLTFVLAVMFYLFFQITKHQPDLSQVNAFADDPYDSVGSAGTQLAMFTALISLVRAFRPYQSNKEIGTQKVLLIRGEYVTCLSVAVTLIVDSVAMIRFLPVWFGFSEGLILLVLMGGMALYTTLVCWLLFRSVQTMVFPSSVRSRWNKAIIVSFVALLVFALYPVYWRQSVPGELSTVFVGMALFFVSVWVWGMTIFPSLEPKFEDFIDDLIAIYGWFKAHAGRLMLFFILFEKMLNLPFLRSVLNGLNPRKHVWKLVIFIGILIGAVLALAEMAGEGGQSSIGQFIRIAIIFIGIEGVGVWLGYGLLGKPLGLFRRDSHKEVPFFGGVDVNLEPDSGGRRDHGLR